MRKSKLNGFGEKKKRLEAGKGKKKIVLMVREETKIILRDAQRSTKKCW